MKKITKKAAAQPVNWTAGLAQGRSPARSVMSYQPCPIDTSKIVLPVEITQLTELLAKNTHENWAKQRISEGWSYGPQGSALKKETPGLVPYEQLPDSEKEYDRKTAMETIKVIQAFGYRIVKR